MEELKELVKIVTNRGQKKIALLDWDEKRPSKDMELFYGIQKGDYTSDEQAAAHLYGGNPDQASYKMLKSRLRKKLLNHLFFLDFKSRSKISHTYEQECLNLLHQVRMLINLGEYKTSERLLNKLLKITTEAEFTYITVSGLELFLFVLAQTGKSYLFYKNREVLVRYRNILSYEQEVEDYYNTAKLELGKSVQLRKEFLPKLSSILANLHILWEKSQSFNVFDFYYKLNIFYHDSTGNYHEIIKITSETDILFEQGKINNKRFDHRFNKFMNVHACLRSKNYEAGLRLAGDYIQAFDESSNNWFAFMENHFLLALHAKQYALAMQLIAQIDKNPFFSKIGRMAKERWALYRGYLYFVYPSEELYTGYTYQTLITSVPEYSKDKQGFNVAILILQYLYFLKKRDMDSLLHRIEAMRKYAGIHLKDNFSDRVKAFFKLLMIPVKEDFKPMYCRKKGKYLFEKLQVIPPPGDAYAEIEIIPYEHLWEMILQILSVNKPYLQASA